MVDSSGGAHRAIDFNFHGVDSTSIFSPPSPETARQHIAGRPGYPAGLVRLSAGLFAHSSVCAPEQAERESHLACGFPYVATWRVRPSGPDRGLVHPAAYMPPARSGCPMPGKEEGGDARYSCRLGSGRRIMGRRNAWAYLPILNYIMQSINVNDKFFLSLCN